MHSIDLAGDSLFDRCPKNPDWCPGHLGEEPTQCATEYTRFGPDGISVTQDGDAPPVVDLQTAVMDWTVPRLKFSPAQARLFAFQMFQAADLAERYAQPSATSNITRMIAEALAAAGR